MYKCVYKYHNNTIQFRIYKNTPALKVTVRIKLITCVITPIANNMYKESKIFTKS